MKKEIAIKEEERCCGNCMFFDYEDINGNGVCFGSCISTCHCSGLCNLHKFRK